MKTNQADTKNQALNIAVQARLLEKSGDTDKARLLYLQAYNLDQSNLDVINNIASHYMAEKDNIKAMEWALIGEKTAPQDPRFWKIIGYTLKRQKRYLEALGYIRRYRVENPKDAAAACQEAETIYRLNKFQECIDFTSHELQKGGEDKRLHLFEMESHIALKQFQEAILIGEMFLEKYGQDEFLAPILAKAYFVTQQLEKAKSCLQTFLEFYPTSVTAWSFLATIAGELEDPDLMLIAAEKVKAIEPRAIEYYANYAIGYARMGKYKEGLELLLEALKAHPTSGSVYYNLCAAHHYNNDLPSALEVYDWWWQTDQPAIRPPRNLKLWHGEDINHKTLNVFFDQGVGDSVEFSRFVTLAAARYPLAKITLTVESKLSGIMKKLLPSTVVIFDRDDILRDGFHDHIDYVVPICSMPACLGVWHWQDLVALPPIWNAPVTPLDYKSSDKPFVVGISWRSIAARSYYYRCLDILDLAFLKEFPNVRVVDLQYGDTSADLKTADDIGFEITHDETVNSWENLLHFAEQVAACDLVISIDNSTVHIAGALGVPCWTMLPAQSHWRWHKEIDWTPWYPNMKLYRAPQGEKLKYVIPQVASDFESWLSDQNKAIKKYQPNLPKLTPENRAVIIGGSQDQGSFAENINSRSIAQTLIASGATKVTDASWYALQLSSTVPFGLNDFDDDQIWSDMWSRNPSLFWQLKRADQVMLEAGTHLIGTGLNAMNLLYVAYNAINRLDKKVHLVGGDIFPELKLYPEKSESLTFYRKVLPLLESVAVSHPVSREIVKALGGKCTDAPNYLAGYIQPIKAQQTNANPLIILTPSLADTMEQIGAQTRLISVLSANGYKLALLGGSAFNERTEYVTWRRMLSSAAKDLQLDIPDLTPETPEDWIKILSSADVILSGSYSVSQIAQALGKKHLVYGDACFRNTVYAADSGQTHKCNSSDPDFAKSLLIAVVKTLR